MTDIHCLAIAGGSGSGKSTLSDALVRSAPAGRVTVLRLDYYFKPDDLIPRTVRGWINYDHPEALDFPRFIRDLRMLLAGRAIEARIDEVRMAGIEGVPVGGCKRVPTAPTVIVEGFLALWHPAVRQMADFAVFLDAPAELRIARRLPEQRSRYIEEVFLPMEARYALPARRYADLIVDVSAMAPDLVLHAVLERLPFQLPRNQP